MSVLSKPKILEHLKAGNIVIEPFNELNLANTSYDVRLGKYFYRQQNLKATQILNPFWESSVKVLYGDVQEASPVSEFQSNINPFYNLEDGDLIILVNPNETILAHTIEFIGGLNGVNGMPAVTTEMRARSSIGRIGITVCKCAGWGDIGYINRWTMEITNVSSAPIPLPVGLRIAQIIFHESARVEDSNKYSEDKARGGKYQTQAGLDDIKKNWTAESMLPKLYKDADLGKFQEYYK